jgi:hypothetical protein
MVAVVDMDAKVACISGAAATSGQDSMSKRTQSGRRLLLYPKGLFARNLLMHAALADGA